MTLGPGKYDKQLENALKECGALEGILIICDSPRGPSFCCQLSRYNGERLPNTLRQMADQIEADMKKTSIYPS